MHDWKPKMQKVASHFAEQIRSIRSGTISVGLIQTIRVDSRELWCRSAGWGRSNSRGIIS